MSLKLLQHFLLPFLCLFSSFGCQKTIKGSYTVGLDPLWYPLDFKEKDNNVIGFSTELLSLISEREKIDITIIPTNWDSLLQGLQEKKYNAVLSSLTPYIFNEQTYDFSQVYLPLGPVLLVPTNTSYTSLESMNGRIIGALSGSSSIFVLETHASILINTYEKATDIINDLLSGKIDGALLPILQAESFSKGTFQSQFKIVTPPLTEEGLRLVTLHKRAPTFLQCFNDAVSAMKKNGDLSQMLVSWNLLSPSSADRLYKKSNPTKK